MASIPPIQGQAGRGQATPPRLTPPGRPAVASAAAASKTCCASASSISCTNGPSQAVPGDFLPKHAYLFRSAHQSPGRRPHGHHVGAGGSFILGHSEALPGVVRGLQLSGRTFIDGIEHHGHCQHASERGYFDHRFNARIINVAPGGQELASAPAEVLSTVWAPACSMPARPRHGPRRHEPLPAAGRSRAPRPCPVREDMRFGVTAMELLINALLKRGAVRSRLEAKVFGGATMLIENAGASVGKSQRLLRACLPGARRDPGSGPGSRRVDAANAPIMSRRPDAPGSTISASRAPRALPRDESAYRQSITRRNTAVNFEVF